MWIIWCALPPLPPPPPTSVVKVLDVGISGPRSVATSGVGMYVAGGVRAASAVSTCPVGHTWIHGRTVGGLRDVPLPPCQLSRSLSPCAGRRGGDQNIGCPSSSKQGTDPRVPSGRHPRSLNTLSHPHGITFHLEHKPSTRPKTDTPFKLLLSTDWERQRGQETR